MSRWDFSQRPSERIAGLMAAGVGGGTDWTDTELGAILRHQLETPIQAELIGLGAAATARLQAMSVTNGDQTALAGIFALTEAPLPLLEIVKEFAKTLLEHPEPTLPKEVSGVLYWTSIAAALARRGARISRLDDVSLIAGMSWALSREWVDSKCRELLRDGLAALQAGDDES